MTPNSLLNKKSRLFSFYSKLRNLLEFFTGSITILVQVQTYFYFCCLMVATIGATNTKKQKINRNKKRVSTLYPNFASYCFTIPIISFLCNCWRFITLTMQIKYITSIFQISILFKVVIHVLQFRSKFSDMVFKGSANA